MSIGTRLGRAIGTRIAVYAPIIARAMVTRAHAIHPRFGRAVADTIVDLSAPLLACVVRRWAFGSQFDARVDSQVQT